MPSPMPLTSEAKQEWVRFYNGHREEQADLDDDLASAWSKLEAYTARLALILQLCRWAEGTASGDAVDAESVRSAIRLIDWFKNEAKRAYAIFVETNDDRDQRRLFEWIERKGGSVTPREVQMGCRWLREPGAAEAALNDSAGAGYGCWQDVPTTPKGGRPARVFVLKTASTVNETPAIPEENEGFVDVDEVDEPENDGADWGVV